MSRGCPTSVLAQMSLPLSLHTCVAFPQSWFLLCLIFSRQRTTLE